MLNKNSGYVSHPYKYHCRMNSIHISIKSLKPLFLSKETMNTLVKILTTLTIFMSLDITLSSTPTHKKPFEIKGDEDDILVSDSPSWVGRFLAQQPRGLMKCNKNPRLCRAKGSPGPDCCNKKCVNVNTDKQNCGLCGRKCKHMEICCKGSCVNPMVNKRHCGGCNYVCKRGDSCVHGMCNYA